MILIKLTMETEKYEIELRIHRFLDGWLLRSLNLDLKTSIYSWKNRRVRTAKYCISRRAYDLSPISRTLNFKSNFRLRFYSFLASRPLALRVASLSNSYPFDSYPSLFNLVLFLSQATYTKSERIYSFYKDKITKT